MRFAIDTIIPSSNYWVVSFRMLHTLLTFCEDVGSNMKFSGHFTEFCSPETKWSHIVKSPQRFVNVHETSFFFILQTYLFGTPPIQAVGNLFLIYPACPMMYAHSQTGLGVTKAISSIPLFSKFCRNLKTHISYWISRFYLTGVAADQLRWHLPNINVVHII